MGEGAPVLPAVPADGAPSASRSAGVPEAEVDAKGGAKGGAKDCAESGAEGAWCARGSRATAEGSVPGAARPSDPGPAPRLSGPRPAPRPSDPGRTVRRSAAGPRLRPCAVRPPTA
ncbi:hypothetical protein GCM10009863_35910 [Streptomyces axinellae]|uniref:Uncharacterized protein n=1 Tax=Streptomyces axinellae TaxID=552788 RepID=A0ABN3Q6N7_9ACTN